MQANQVLDEMINLRESVTAFLEEEKILRKQLTDNE